MKTLIFLRTRDIFLNVKFLLNELLRYEKNLILNWSKYILQWKSLLFLCFFHFIDFFIYLTNLLWVYIVK